MREHGAVGHPGASPRGLTRFRPGSPAVPAADLVGRNFTAQAPATRLVGDLTYIPTGEVVGY